MNIFVGNLSFEAKAADMERAFRNFGVVTSAVIVMEKKGKKSRGFGFVEMPDEQEAQAAIAQLDGQQILGRPINVMPALSKEPKKPKANKKEDQANSLNLADHGAQASEPGYKPGNLQRVFKRTGKYKEGKRSLSYLKKRMSVGLPVRFPERKRKSNPLRWRKKTRWEDASAKPEGLKSAGGFKARPHPSAESNSWRKPKPKAGDWKKPEGEFSARQSHSAVSKPWVKTQSSQTRPWKKTKETAKPWQKTSGESRPPWRKSSPQGSRPGFKKRKRF